MKTTFKFIIAAMAAISVFSSCQKELANESVSNTTDGVRTISVQFDNSTKASLSGFTPSFTNGDKIRVSNTEKSEECTVTVGGTVTFTTTLSGALTAIYPAAAAVYTSGTPDGPISSPYFKVSASQDGDIAKAIIAKADITAESSTATFNVQTALFEITPPDGVKSFTVTSLKTVVSGARTGNAIAINTEGETDAEKLVITVSNNSLSTFYVALKAGVNLSDLSFEYITDATKGLGAMKGIPAKDIAAAGKTDATAANAKYTINSQNWHSYVTIGTGAGARKWATMNIGATETNSYGTYFSWGEVAGHTPSAYTSGSTFTFPSTKPEDPRYPSTWSAGSGFDDCNTPYYDGSDYSSSKYKDNSSATLKLSDDAANANWGGSWRMPTKEEFDALTSVEGSAWDGTGTVKGYRFGTSPNQIFLPAAGYGDGTDLSGVGDGGRYWSSSLFTDDPYFAYFLYFFGGDAGTDYYYRCRGRSVRALSE